MEAQETSQGAGGTIVGMATKTATFIVGTVALVWQKATKDGTLAAAGRMGIDELGAALKAFPDAIQVQESGSIWNPTQGEIMADRKPSIQGYRPMQNSTHRSPSQIAAEGPSVHGQQSNSQQLGQEAATPRSPSDIANEKTPHTTQQQHEHDQGYGY